jgi:hypothetical protein
MSTCETDRKGTRRWYFIYKLHREDGPAIEYTNGNYEWYFDGKYHREDGPAVKEGGTYKWYIHGKLIGTRYMDRRY